MIRGLRSQQTDPRNMEIIDCFYEHHIIHNTHIGTTKQPPPKTRKHPLMCASAHHTHTTYRRAPVHGTYTELHEGRQKRTERHRRCATPKHGPIYCCDWRDQTHNLGHPTLMHFHTPNWAMLCDPFCSLAISNPNSRLVLSPL